MADYRLAKGLSAAGGDLSLREKAEKKDRERWTRALLAHLQLAKLPVVDVLNERGGLSMGHVAKGRRGSTLRKHVKTWDKVSSWLYSTYQVCWPTCASQMADYLGARVEEPCSRSTPVSIYKTFMFLEYAGEVPECDQMHRAPCIQNTLEKARVRLEQVETMPRRKASPLLVSMVEAMEREVCNEDQKPFVRAYSWIRLVKLWSGMRFNDIQGVAVRTVEVSRTGLYAEIHRSKTSGPGRRMLVLPVYISLEAWLVEKDWLVTGWEVWHGLGVESRLEARLHAPVPQ